MDEWRDYSGVKFKYLTIDGAVYKFHYDTPCCPWCGEIFKNWSAAKLHIKHCYMADYSERRKRPMARVSINDYYSDKEFLKADDVKKETIALTIVSAEPVRLGNRTQLVLRFKETPKSFGLSKADLARMLKLHGSESDDWIGKKVTLEKQPSETPRGVPTITLHLTE